MSKKRTFESDSDSDAFADEKIENDPSIVFVRSEEFATNYKQRQTRKYYSKNFQGGLPKLTKPIDALMKESSYQVSYFFISLFQN